MKIAFTINGNQENPKGNPIPYHRATQKSRWSPECQRYEAWKSYVQEAFYSESKKFNIERIFSDDPPEKLMKKMMDGKITKPINLKKKMRTDIFIYWANNAHGDPDNILKGVNDALYQNDKLVAGSVDFAEKPTGEGKLEIIITL